jgi:hypothetical protein
MSEAQARATGLLARRSRHEDVVDLVVVEGALRRRDAVVTADRKDIARIADALGVALAIESV